MRPYAVILIVLGSYLALTGLCEVFLWRPDRRRTKARLGPLSVVEKYALEPVEEWVREGEAAAAREFPPM